MEEKSKFDGDWLYVATYMVIGCIVGYHAYVAGLALWKSIVIGIGWYVFAGVIVGEFIQGLVESGVLY